MEIPTQIPTTDPDVAEQPMIGVAEPQMAESPVLEEPVRKVNFILDPSAFTLGLGNIERWFDDSYFQSQVKDKSENIHLNMYLPTYTLHELDYQKRGPIVGSTKALEALKFIDRMLDCDDGLSDFFDEEEEKDVSGRKTGNSLIKGHFLHSLYLEHRTHQFPQWSACSKFQIRSPSTLELPNHGKYSLYDEINHFGGDTKEITDDEPEIPARLKHLIRSGIYLTRMNHNGPEQITGDMWKIVTEDTAIKVWAGCFGIDCLNINEAELLLFHGKDLAKFEIKAQGADFFSGNDIYQMDAPDLLHKKVNTTSYNYTDLKALQKKPATRAAGKRKPGKAAKKEAKLPQETAEVERDLKSLKVEGGVITEDFNMINFAPREQSTKLVVSKLFAKEPKSSNKPKKATKTKNSGDKAEGISVPTEKKPVTKKKSTGRKKPAKKSNSVEQEKVSEVKETGELATAPQGDSLEKQGSGKKLQKKKPALKKKAPKKKDPEGTAKVTETTVTSEMTTEP